LLARRGITICIANALHDPDVVASVDPLVARDRIMQRAVIRLRADTIPGEDPLCHELMHVLTGIDDIPYDQEHRFPYENDSCIWGYLGTPGAFDRQFMRWIYRKAAGRRQVFHDPASNARGNGTGRRGEEDPT
jgi:hypothetical protein